MPLEKLKSFYANYRLNKINSMEKSLNKFPDALRASTLSAEKKMPDKLKITLKTLPRQLSIAKNMEKTIKSLDSNPAEPLTQMDPVFRDQFEEYAFSKGISNIGYTEVPAGLIFKDRRVLFNRAIVLTMPMDKTAVDLAPSPRTQENGVVTYDQLGKITNDLASYLRENGFGAHASHPAGGLVIYTHLAEKSGLGCVGRHGLLISAPSGPVQRISAIFTSAENLPPTSSPEYSWVNEFCAKCGRCIKHCPTNAITEEKLENGLNKTKIITELCEGCTICMKECSFNRKDYASLKTRFEASK